MCIIRLLEISGWVYLFNVLFIKKKEIDWEGKTAEKTFEFCFSF